jgi:DNA gyrase subunit B
MTHSIPEGTAVPGNPEPYSTVNIVVLEGAEACRKRPGMYIGDVHDGSGLLCLVNQFLEEAVEHEPLGCRQVTVTIHQDGSIEIERDGAPMPTRVIHAHGKSGAELEMTTVLGGRRAREWDSGALDHLDEYQISARSFGVGLAPCNALSIRVELAIQTGGSLHRQSYRQGKPEGPFVVTGQVDPGERQSIRLWPDPTIFSSTDIDLTRLETRLAELALLNPRMRFDIQINKQRSHVAPRGLQDGLARLSPHHPTTVGPVIAGSGEFEGVQVDLAMQWVDHPWTGEIASFVNEHRTPDGGAHVKGLLAAVDGAIRQERERAGRPLERKQQADTMSGLHALIRVQLDDPSYSCSRGEIYNKEARVAVQRLAERLIAAAVASSPELRERLAR